MITNPSAHAQLAERLKEFGADLERWRAEADRLRAVADEAISARQVDEEMLVKVEHSAGVLYDEIKTFNTLVADVAGESPAAAAELAPVDDSLHLLLLEITELGTRLYGLRSRQAAVAPGSDGVDSPVVDGEEPAVTPDDGIAGVAEVQDTPPAAEDNVDAPEDAVSAGDDAKDSGTSPDHEPTTARPAETKPNP